MTLCLGVPAILDGSLRFRQTDPGECLALTRTASRSRMTRLKSPADLAGLLRGINLIPALLDSATSSLNNHEDDFGRGLAVLNRTFYDPELTARPGSRIIARSIRTPLVFENYRHAAAETPGPHVFILKGFQLFKSGHKPEPSASRIFQEVLQEGHYDSYFGQPRSAV